MLFCAFSDVGAWGLSYFLLMYCLFVCADILTKSPLGLFGISSGFFDTVIKILIYLNKSFYIDKNGVRAFSVFACVRS